MKFSIRFRIGSAIKKFKIENNCEIVDYSHNEFQKNLNIGNDFIGGFDKIDFSDFGTLFVSFFTIFSSIWEY